MISQQNYLDRGIQKLNMHLINQYMVEYSCKYSQIIGCDNNWIIMNYFDDATDEEAYEHII